MSSGPFVLALPGASLMRLAPHADGNGVTVTCPGCGAAESFRRPGVAGASIGFRHAADDCPVLAQIDAALLTARPPRGVE